MLILNIMAGIARRFERFPITNTEQIADFAGSRAAYVTQTALFGYLKTRMGTQFRLYFEDKAFAREIKQASTTICASSISDVVIYITHKLVKETGLSRELACKIGSHLFVESSKTANITGSDKPLEPQIAETFAAAKSDFNTRCLLIDWAALSDDNEAIFTRSCAALVRHAPVSEEFRISDAETISASMKFRWNIARQQLDKRMVPAKIVEDFLSGTKT